METVIFNTHDVALLITVYECVLFAFCLITLKRGSKQSNLLLAAFLLSYAAIPLDTLINFGAAFRQTAIDFSPNIFFICGHAYWLEAVFLLFYVRSLVYKDYRLSKRDLFYFLPFVLYLIYEMNNWHLLDSETKLAFLNGYQLAEEPWYNSAINLFRECFRTFCGILCLIELRRYQRQIRNQLADIESVDLTWLKTLVIGFLAVRLTAVFVTLGFIFTFDFGITFDYGLLGLLSNWTTLFLISFLIFYSLGFTTVFSGIIKKEEKSADKEIDPMQIQQIEQYMVSQKPFLDHLLTIDKLSSQLDIPARQLSQIINRHFEQNFFEFINKYRIEESKALLLNEAHQKSTMLDIMDMAGFNSKATFNTFFKKLVGETPTQYRKLHSNH